MLCVALREAVGRPFRCLDSQYRRELVRVYLTNVEGICRRFVEEKREKLSKLVSDEVRFARQVLEIVFTPLIRLLNHKSDDEHGVHVLFHQVLQASFQAPQPKLMSKYENFQR